VIRAILLAILLALGCSESVAPEEVTMHHHPHLNPTYRADGIQVEPAVAIEPTGGPWKNNNNWGAKFEGPMPLQAGVRLSVFDGSQIPGPPRVQTIILARDPQSTPGDNADFRALIEYGVGGLVDNFVCDWTRGTQITLVANWVRVNAISYAPNSLAPYKADDGRVTISAGVAEGTARSASTVTLTDSLRELNDGGDEDIAVPDFARALAIKFEFIGGVMPTPSDVGFSFQAGTNPLARYTAEDMNLAFGGVLIPGGSNFIRVKNNSGLTIRYAPMWVLSL
jgi:hypothetical protein